MIPSSEITHLRTYIPSEATFWVPAEDDIDEEGVGAYFRDTWLILETDFRFAKEATDYEIAVIPALDATARTPEEFEELAIAIESGTDDNLSKEITARAEFGNLSQYIDEEFNVLDGLEIGVSGLVLALSATGFIPVASCRGHPHKYAWSPHPVVYIATNRTYLESLVPHILDTGCRLDIDPARPELIVLAAGSVTEMNKLAGLVLKNRSTVGGACLLEMPKQGPPPEQDPLPGL